MRENSGDPALRRRKEHRHRRRLRVTFDVQGREHVAFTIDVSRTGLFVASNHFQSIASTLELRVELPSGGTIDLTGQVTRTREPPPQLATLVRRGFGVRLVEPPPSWTRFIEAMERPAR